MGISKKAIVVLVPSLMFGIGAPAWSGTTDPAAPIDAQVMPVSPRNNTLFNMISSILTATDTSPRQPKAECKASHLYTQHDVVGDPDACLMGRYTAGVGATSIGSVPSVP